jgi:hypothetical protein
MKTIEDLHADLELAEKIGMEVEEEEVIDALNDDYREVELSIDENGSVWGAQIDPEDFDSTTTSPTSWYGPR